jgi:hypothetical protein
MLPSDYLHSRQTFRELARSLGVEPKCFNLDEHAEHGQHTNRAGNEPRLSTDVVHLGPVDAPTLVVISSGTHGVEGYAGAACQFRFMQSWRSHFASDRVAYLLVHAVNPWGYFHDRRVTQEGVDLNRNFIDFPVASRQPSAYAPYHHLLVSNFRPLPAGLWNEMRLFSGAVTKAQRTSLQAAVTEGQYDHPDGLFFGGHGPARSRVVWEQITAAYALGRKRAFLLDLHTGLGKRGVGELISYLPVSSQDFQRLSRWFDGDLKSMANGDSVSATLEGTLTAGFDRSMEGESYAVGLEFGTRSPLVVLHAMRADQWYRNNAHRLTDTEREHVRRKMKRAFCISDAQWHRQVTSRFDQVMAQLLAALCKCDRDS